jgi:hypothetical protein
MSEFQMHIPYDPAISFLRIKTAKNTLDKLNNYQKDDLSYIFEIHHEFQISS